jgi:hypothetical protein
MAQSKIEQELFDHFEKLRMRGDCKEIAVKNGVTPVLIYKAFQTHKCSKRVLNMLIEFYTKRNNESDNIKNVLQALQTFKNPPKS